MSDSYPLVAEDVVEMKGQSVQVKTCWTGGVEVNEVTLAVETSLFESKIMGGRYDGMCYGYGHLVKAIRGHDGVVAALRAGKPLP